MNERKEPTISSYSPGKDDVRQPSVKHGPARINSIPNSSQSPAARPVVVRSTLAPVAFLVALIACGGAGFLYWQMQHMEQLITQADARIVDLESKFELSDDESTASLETLQAKLKSADSEIRKLWAVSYDTNRKAIADNKAEIEKLWKTSTALSKTSDALTKSLDGQVKTATQGISADVKLVSDLVDAQQTSLSAIEQRNAQLVKSTQSLNDTIGRLEASRGELERRIRNNEQAIESIDAFRRTVNQQILELRAGGS